MMSTAVIQGFLGRTELFREVDAEELEALGDIAQVRRAADGEVLFHQNAPRQNLWVIAEGTVELFMTTAWGEDKRIARFGPRDFLGEGALMDDYPHSTSARTVGPATLITISRAKFNTLIEERPSIAIKVLSRVARVISRRMRQTSTRVVNAGAQYISGRTRREHDLLGERDVPDEFYYGIQTLRALENFNISGISLMHFPVLIESLAMVKMAAARANRDLGLLPEGTADAIVQACEEIVEGKWHTQFVVDMIQGGAGTSTNMNANEVIANRALELLGHEKGEYRFCHPNNHVNLSQSTNDAYPTALHLALIFSNRRLVEVLERLIGAIRVKASAFAHVIKMGRTQLQDAVPMTLGQSFEAYAATLSEEIMRLNENAALFLEVNLGGTAIGTGINAHPDYAAKAVAHLREISGLELVSSPDLIEATSDTGAFVMYSSALKRLSVKLSKICNDLRLLSSGPRAGLNEINLPKMQPGSSIMPGKVNPVIPEVVNQVAFKAVGNDLTVTMAAEAGQLELNVFEPVIAQSILESIEMLKRGMNTLNFRCIRGITANEEVCRRYVAQSIGIVTALSPVLGHETCDGLAREAQESGRSVYDLVLEKGLLSQQELDRLLAPENMIRPSRNNG